MFKKKAQTNRSTPQSRKEEFLKKINAQDKIRIKSKLKLPEKINHPATHSVTEASDVTTEVSTRLRRWSRGIFVVSVLFAASVLLSSGWGDLAIVERMIFVLVLALGWAFFLSYNARKVDLFQYGQRLIWANAAILLLLATLMICTTGGALSPFFWLYSGIIVAETIQSRPRGIIVAWTSFGIYLLIAAAFFLREYSIALPDGTVQPQHLHSSGLLYVLSIAVWYLVIALSVCALAAWIRRYEQEIKKRHEAVGKREKAIEELKTKLQDGKTEVGQRTFQLDQAKRQLEAEQKEWGRNRKQWEVQRAQMGQQLSDEQAALDQKIQSYESQRRSFKETQQRFESETQQWGEARARRVKSLDDREAALTEQSQSLDESHKAFEKQRATTTKSLIELEQTLMSNLDQVGKEVRDVEAKRHEIEAAKQDLTLQRARWSNEQEQKTSSYKDTARRSD